ncbi:MAG: hypothetical protein A6F72_02045 [Cycloclasticus sp. symbiont of Poecilosclerida sp. N]|nr:MAG: hypothetical protein A6F72_02045 [Cycloclasticus sp. symbiont of Poecilosclerida sp. N]
MPKANRLTIHFSVVALLVLFCASCLAYSSLPTSNSTKSDFFHTFSGNLVTELARAKEEKKFGVLLYFSTAHCPFCKRMKKTVFSQAPAQEYFNTHFRLIEINIESEQPLTTPRGQVTSYVNFAKANRVRLTPTISFLNQQGEPVYRHVGMMADPQEFIWLGEYVVSGQTQRQSFATYKMNKRRKKQP